MSLYDGIDNKEGGDTAADVVSGWSSAYKLLHSQLQAKKVASLQNKRQKQTPTMAPVVDLKRHADLTDQPLHFNQQTGRLERGPPASLGSSPFIASEPVPSLTGVTDEYDPLRPNEYEEIVKKRREQRQKEREEEKIKKDKDRDESVTLPSRGTPTWPEPPPPPPPPIVNTPEPTSEMERGRRREEENEEEEEYEKPKRPASGVAIPPPISLIEEDTVANPEETPEATPNSERASSPPPLGFSIGLGGSVASKIMAKYGYKEGQGLGKQEQGMSTALFVEKTSKRGGKIIHEKDMQKDPPRDMTVTNSNLLKHPSKVILLRNMVGSGEVDDDLEPETAEECAKYGKVVKCLIFEIPGCDDEEAVRIFVEFERVESAIKAVVDLNGRYFGGRVVKASFYNLDKFRQYDLAEEQEF
ncbi:splicing factor 45 [Octopus sinensis]|uniref:Splicing factor 45 n=1 Tax=Octopus sinensis TaxID=2607531 RepID=A0A6P7SAM6_9MOLL|nr:splicing factor 45 [Octopus sinensis]